MGLGLGLGLDLGLGLGLGVGLGLGLGLGLGHTPAVGADECASRIAEIGHEKPPRAAGLERRLE